MRKTVFRRCPFHFDFLLGCPWDNLLRLADFFLSFCHGTCPYKGAWEIGSRWHLLLSDLYETVQKTVFRRCPRCFDFLFGRPWDNILRLADFFFSLLPRYVCVQGSVGNRLRMTPASFWSLRDSVENGVQTMPVSFWFYFWVSTRQPSPTCRLFFWLSFCPGTCL